jgi:ATP-dependent Clp protease ATP-binding subunit ClpC
MFRFSGFTADADKIINEAINYAIDFRNNWIGTEHLLYAMCNSSVSEPRVILLHSGMDHAGASDIKEQLLENEQENNGRYQRNPTALTPEDFTKQLKITLEMAIIKARQREKKQVTTLHILEAIADIDCGAHRIAEEIGVDWVDVNKALGKMNEESEDGQRSRRNTRNGGRGREEGRSDDRRRQRNRSERTEIEYSSAKNIIETCTRDLTKMAEEGLLDPVLCRDEEAKKVLHVLLRRKKNNACLVGDAGVGKTAVVERLAQMIIDREVPKSLYNAVILALDLPTMIAGSKYRGDFEEKITVFLTEMRRHPEVIIFIDEVHGLVGAGEAEGAIDAANIMKPYLARGDLKVIGATTLREYRRYIESDSALERRFQSVLVEQPSEKDSIMILDGLKSYYEEHHSIDISDGAIEAAVKLSARYVADRMLPDKAIDLLDQTASRLRYEKAEDSDSSNDEADDEQLDDETTTLKYEMTADDIAKQVSINTGIEVSVLARSEKDKLKNLESNLKNVIVGQDEAIDAVSRVVRLSKAGLNDPNKPIGSFMFLGPTGVGKTALCNALANELFNKPEALIRLDMSEYMDKHDYAKLLGSPPGYIGYDEEGQLTSKVRRNPYSIILLDEIEKAHPTVLNVLLQMLSDGRLTDAKGRTVSFKNTIIVMTSNIGNQKMALTPSRIPERRIPRREGEEVKPKNTKEGIIKELQRVMLPELINRIDYIVAFNNLNQGQLVEIARKEADKLIQRAAESNMELVIQDSAVKALVNMEECEVYGARPIQRNLTKEIADRVSCLVIEEDLTDCTVVCSYNKGFRVAKKQKSAAM